MVDAVMASFEADIASTIVLLEESATTAAESASLLEETSLKYSWNATVAPNPALAGDLITIRLQGQPGLLPMLDIYSWDDKIIYDDQRFTEVDDGLYVFEFSADKQFRVGKAYLYIISEQTTGGLVAGSATVEAMTLTEIAGLAASAPNAEKAAKKALDAIKAVEAVLISGESINIALTLKNLKESVDELPEMLSSEGPSVAIINAINKVAEKISALAGEEGYDMKTILEEALGESSTLKEIRNKTDAVGIAVDVLSGIFEYKFGGREDPIIKTSLKSGSVIFQLVAVNPSKTKTQKIYLKEYLPKEATPDAISDTGGLEIEYDTKKAIYFVHKEIELAPSEMRKFEVHIEDIWMIPEKRLAIFEERIDAILKHLKDTEYITKAEGIAKTVYLRIEDIKTSQTNEAVSRQRHIGIYRQNLLTIEGIKEDVARMEEILVTAGGPPAPEMLADAKIKADAPSKTMTWIVIFIIIIFVGLLAGVLFFTWHRQSQHTKDVFSEATKSAFPEAESKPQKEEKV